MRGRGKWLLFPEMMGFGAIQPPGRRREVLDAEEAGRG
jgi:hypothetical protein